MIINLIVSLLFWVDPVHSAPLKIETTFSILADIVNRVDGQSKAVPLVGPDRDVHAFEPTPHDLQNVAKADLIVMNGLGLDFWMDRLISAAHHRGEKVVASEGATLLGNDPHCWQDPICGIQYIENIKKALIKLRPDRMAEVSKRAEDYQNEIRTVFAKYKQQFASLPADQRKILTSHDSLAYFGRAYGIEIYTLRGPTTASENSAAQLAVMTKLIKEKKLRVGFFENSSEDRALRQLAKDYGLKMGGTLYTDSLSKNAEGSTYLKMLETNASRVFEQLKGLK